jgi:hypothetical protein
MMNDEGGAVMVGEALMIWLRQKLEGKMLE